MTEDKPLEIGALDTLVGYHLRRASLVFYPDYRKAKGVRQGLVGILSIVEANPGINQKTVGEMLLIDAGNLVALIDDLVKQRFLVRAVDPKDRRSRSLTITRAGTQQLRTTLQSIDKMEKRRLSQFSQQERESLLSLLRRIHVSSD